MGEVGVRDLDWREFDSELCSIQRTLALIGEKWTILIIRDAANGIRRFDDFRKHTGVSEAVLSDRLRNLVARGILETREYREPGQRRRHEYRLTARGWDLFPVLIALMQWGDAHLDGEQPWQVRHRGCEAPVRAEVRCTSDGERLTPRDTEVVPGPGVRRRRAG
jgi:DNA-binding HxlR family transcriptional regulator